MTNTGTNGGGAVLGAAPACMQARKRLEGKRDRPVPQAAAGGQEVGNDDDAADERGKDLNVLDPVQAKVTALPG